MAEEHKCGECQMFKTPQCSFAYSTKLRNPSTPKVVKTWKELVAFLYDFNYLNSPEGSRKVVSNFNLLFASDKACAEFQPLSAYQQAISRKIFLKKVQDL